jgi:DNA-binding transcriptional LysR family regulator
MRGALPSAVGSFPTAARRLNISKSAVSACVQRLDERLGIRLLNRTTRRLSLTAAGAPTIAIARAFLSRSRRRTVTECG